MFKALFGSLRNKILAGYFVVIFIMIFIMFWDLFNFNRLNQSYKQIIVQNYASILASENMLRALDNHLNALMLLKEKDTEQQGRKLFEDSKEDFFFWLDKAQQSAYTDNERNTLDSLNSEYKILLSKVSLLKANLSNGKNTNTQDDYFDFIKTTSEIKSRCFGLFEINHTLIANTENQIRDITLTAAFTMLFLAMLGIIVSLIFSTKFSKYIVKPVNELTNSIQRVSAGNFTQTLETNEQDEIGKLAIEFNNMIVRLQKYEELNINKLLSEKKKSESVIESINDPVVMIDQNYEILLSNKAFDQILRKDSNNRFRQIINDEKIIHDINDIIGNKSDSVERGIYVYKNENVTEKYFEVKYSLIKLPENDINAVLIVFTDITKYEELDRLKSEFVAKVSHELKTPLTSIGMAAGILDDEIVGTLTIKQKELLKSIKGDYSRLYSLVKEILELSKIESERVKLNLRRIDLVQFLDSCIKKYSLQSEKKGLSVKLNVSSKPIYIQGDPEYLASAIGNFIDNSIKFTQPGGKIEIDVKPYSNVVKVRIQDNGQGIDSIYLDKIFDKFVQISDKSPGSVGLGLSIAKEIIEMHKGTINVWSKKGMGSKFEINLPEYKNE
jgi:two-component system, NtrC family, sensor histidine kinase KinB